MTNTTKTLHIVLAVALLSLLWTTPMLAQSSHEVETLSKEVEMLKEGQATIRKELEELRNLLKGRAVSPRIEPENLILSVDGAPFMGDKNAAVTLIDFSDYQCPFCGRHVRETLVQIERDYIRTGKVKYIFRDFPIESIHPQVFKVHEAARCAGEQGKFWEMHGRLFTSQKTLSPNDLTDQAQALGLDMSNFQQCVESAKYAAAIREDLTEGGKAGVNGTPSFFLGLTEPSNSKVKVLRVLKGAQSFPSFKEVIDGLLLPPSQKK